jgi:hypothetical protein
MRNWVRGLLWLSLLIPGLKVMGQTPPKREGTQQACPDTIGWTGGYTNYSYRFSIEIPKRLQGFWNSSRCSDGPDGCICMSDHGRIIPLTKEPFEPERHIEVYAAYAVDLDERTLAGEVTKHLDSIRERSHGGNVEVRRRVKIRLGGIDAERVVVRYYDDESKTWRVEDFVQALREDVDYSLYLRTREESYPQDQGVFDSVVQSFTVRR